MSQRIDEAVAELSPDSKTQPMLPLGVLNMRTVEAPAGAVTASATRRSSGQRHAVIGAYRRPPPTIVQLRFLPDEHPAAAGPTTIRAALPSELAFRRVRRRLVRDQLLGGLAGDEAGAPRPCPVQPVLPEA